MKIRIITYVIDNYLHALLKVCDIIRVKATENIVKQDKPETEMLHSSQSSGRPLDLDEAAVYLHYSPKYLYRLTHEGRIAFYKPEGGKLFFTKEDLDKFVLRNRHAADFELRDNADQKIFELSSMARPKT